MTSLINLFTYGTLMIPKVFEKVTGIQLTFKQGNLRHYDCFRLINQTYPGIVFKQNTSTQGVVYLKLNPEIINRLDKFEGDLYNRQTVSVETESDHMVQAYAYVLVPGAERFLSTERWSREHFEKYHLDDFVRNDSGFINVSREKTLISFG